MPGSAEGACSFDAANWIRTGDPIRSACTLPGTAAGTGPCAQVYGPFCAAGYGCYNNVSCKKICKLGDSSGPCPGSCVTDPAVVGHDLTYGTAKYGYCP